MQIKYQVFISSTYEDLRDERRIVIEQILNLGHIPVGMELFQAGDEIQWDYIKKRILECDYYIVILGERYGSVGPEGKSYTQMEYEFAVANGVPVAAFPLHQEARKKWPKDRVEWERREAVEAFRKLCESRMAKHWRNADELGARVVTALVEMTNTSPRVGWVRADSVATEAALNEIAKLSEERRALQEQVERYKALEGGLRVPPDIQHRIAELASMPAAELLPKNPSALRVSQLSLCQLFLRVYRRFTSEMEEVVACACVMEALEINRQQVDFYLTVPVLAEFVVHNLLETNIRRNKIDVPFTHYKLTEYGKTFALYAGLQSDGPEK